MQRSRLLRVSALLACAAAAGSCGAPPPAVKPAASPAPTAAATARAEPPPPRDDGRLPSGVRPTGYQLSLHVDPAKDGFEGHVQIGIQVAKPTRAIVMHARKLEIESADVVVASRHMQARPLSRMAAHGREAPEELVLMLPEELPPGAAIIDIHYKAPFGTGLRGLYRVHDAGDDYAYTQFEPNDARRAFPCFDEPGFKTPFSLELTVPKADRALSNTPVDKRADNSDGTVTYTFEKSKPLPTYLVAMGVGPFDVLEGAKKPVPIRLVTVKGKAKLGRMALALAPEILDALAKYFDQPYPYKKMDIVAVPNFGAGAMENAGFVTFREELLLLDPKHASVRARRAELGVMAHEFSHQWFGDLVTMAWWNDLWLNEGFASWMGAKVSDQIQPGFGAHERQIVEKSWVMGEDALGSARKIRQPVRSTSEALEAFDDITYVKGMSVLDMVESWLGPDKFQQGIRAYVKAYRFGNATATDLFKALGEASGTNVASVMDTFLDQKGVPLVTATLDCKDKKPVLALGQQQYRAFGTQPPDRQRSWNIPVCVSYPAAGKHRTQCTVLDGRQGKLALETKVCPGFVYPNAGEGGYYRSALTAKQLQQLAGRAQRDLAPTERIGLVGNAWAMVDSGALPAPALLGALETLMRHERDRGVIQQVTATLRLVHRKLVDDKAKPAFVRYVDRLLGPTARRVGFKPEPHEPDGDALLRRDVLSTIGDLGSDKWTQRQAAAVAKAWLEAPDSVDADSAAVAVSLHARHGDVLLFDALKKRLVSAGTPEQRLIALGGLTGFDNPKLATQVLALTLDGTIKTQDLRYIFAPLFQRRATRDLAYWWMTRHFEELKKRVPSFVIGRLVGVLSYFCDRPQIQKARAFFSSSAKDIEGADREFKQAVEAGEQCVALRASQGAGVDKWLEGKR